MEGISKNSLEKHCGDQNKNKTSLDAEVQFKNTVDNPKAEQPSNSTPRPRGLGEHIQIVFWENQC